MASFISTILVFFFWLGLMRIKRQGEVYKFSSCTEDCRKSNETLSIMAEMGEFALILMGYHWH